MLKRSKTKVNFFYYLVGGLGLSCAILLAFFFKNNVAEEPLHQFHYEDRELVTKAQSNDDGFFITHESEQSELAVKPVNDTGSAKCAYQCKETLSMLDGISSLNDETFHQLGSYTKEIAAYLEHEESKRHHYLEMALTTKDADKRSFLTDVFIHLPYHQKVELADSYIVSEDWRLRANGVTLIAGYDIATVTVGHSLMDIFANEESSYIKSNILTHIEQSSVLQGDTEILHQLDSAIYNETDSSVRVAALKAKMQLSEQPYHILPDALQALRTNEPEFQLAGLVVIEKVLQQEKTYIASGHQLDVTSIKNEFEIIRNLAVYGENKKNVDRLIEEANMIYLRYFNE